MADEGANSSSDAGNSENNAVEPTNQDQNGEVCKGPIFWGYFVTCTIYFDLGKGNKLLNQNVDSPADKM